MKMDFAVENLSDFVDEAKAQLFVEVQGLSQRTYDLSKQIVKAQARNFEFEHDVSDVLEMHSEISRQISVLRHKVEMTKRIFSRC